MCSFPETNCIASRQGVRVWGEADDASAEAAALSGNYHPGSIGRNHEEWVEDTREVKIPK